MLLAIFTAIHFHADTALQNWARNALFDAYQALLPRERTSAPVTVIAIDEKSLAEYGQWPWPRTRIAQLIEAAASYQPLAIGIDIIFAEPDRLSPGKLADSYPQIDPSLAGALRELPSNDAVLSDAIRRLPVVLGVAGMEQATGSPPPISAAAFLLQGDPMGHMWQFPGALTSIDAIDAAAASRGLVSADSRSGVVRRVPLVASIAGAPLPALSLETLRLAVGADRIDVRAGPRGIESVAIADVVVPTHADGQVWVRYGEHDPARFVSAVDVIERRVDPERLERKLALVGVTGLGLLDWRATPLGSTMPGLEIHAQVLENIFDGNLLARPDSMRWIESGLLVALGIMLIVAVTTVSPLRSAVLLAVEVAAGLIVGLALFKYSGVLFDAALPTIALNILFAAVLASTLFETERHRRRLQVELEAEREAAARLAGELEAARRVQLGMLPVASRAFPSETRFELHALMSPAKEVGGDLYDFYMIDGSRLFFMVGDVSGKGLAASIFMALSKALYKSATLRSSRDLGRAMSAANAEISRDNPEEMFVTALACVLDVDSGELTWCNAGHEAPYALAPHASSARALAGESGPPLCVLEQHEYQTNRYTLSPGETLVLISDGVTEAMDGEGRLFGRSRLEALLAGLPRGYGIEQSLAAVHEEVKRFSTGTEMADDVTLLGVCWHGPARSAQ